MTFIRTVLIALACLLWASGAFAQGKWTKLAVFPEPAEELLGASAGGRMYVFAASLRDGSRSAWCTNTIRRATSGRRRNRCRSLPITSRSPSTRADLRLRRIRAPASGPAAWVPIDNAWEYDPATDNWKALAPLPTKRGSPVAVTVGDKMYVIGGATTLPGSTVVHPARPHYSVGAVEGIRSRDQHLGARARRFLLPAITPRPACERKGLRDRRACRRRLRIERSSNVGIVEEYDPAADAWGAPRARMPSARSAMSSGAWGGKIYVTGGEDRTT